MVTIVDNDLAGRHPGRARSAPILRGVRALPVSAALIVVSALVQIPAEVSAQLPPDSVTAWTEALRTGTLPERAHAVSRLSEADGATLPAATRSALIEELERVNGLLIAGQGVPSQEDLGSAEALGGYTTGLSTLVYQIDTEAARRALAGSVGISPGISRRFARLGDEAVQRMDAFLERRYEVDVALETMGHAWFWADSTGAPLSDDARATVVGRVLGALESGEFVSLLGAGAALEAMGDPSFLPLVRRQPERLRSVGEEVAARTFEFDVLPRLEAAASDASAVELADGTRRLLHLLCEIDAGGARGDFCRSTRELMDALMHDLRRGRTDPAKATARTVVRQIDQAVRLGRIDVFEHALVEGAALQVLARLEGSDV